MFQYHWLNGPGDDLMRRNGLDQMCSSELVVPSIIPVEVSTISTNSGPSPDSLIQTCEKWSVFKY